MLINQELHETKLKLQEANCLNKYLNEKYANVSEANNLLKSEIETLSKQNIELKINFEGKIHSMLLPFFTKTQINYFINPKNKIIKWELEDITKAITLKSISTKAYNYLRDTLHYALPGLYFKVFIMFMPLNFNIPLLNILAQL